MVARRRSEIGIRLALGATRRRVIALVLGEGVILVAAGIAIGVPVTIVLTRFLSAQLFGVSPTDPATIVSATAAMIAIAALAGLLPARRASRIDPMVALRCD